MGGSSYLGPGELLTVGLSLSCAPLWVVWGCFADSGWTFPFFSAGTAEQLCTNRLAQAYSHGRAEIHKEQEHPRLEALQCCSHLVSSAKARFKVRPDLECREIDYHVMGDVAK